jgi:hypothetical protein
MTDMASSAPTVATGLAPGYVWHGRELLAAVGIVDGAALHEALVAMGTPRSRVQCWRLMRPDFVPRVMDLELLMAISLLTEAGLERLIERGRPVPARAPRTMPAIPRKGKRGSRPIPPRIDIRAGIGLTPS